MKFLDRKWPPPSEIFRKFIRFGRLDTGFPNFSLADFENCTTLVCIFINLYINLCRVWRLVEWNQRGSNHTIYAQLWKARWLGSEFDGDWLIVVLVNMLTRRMCSVSGYVSEFTLELLNLHCGRVSNQFYSLHSAVHFVRCILTDWTCKCEKLVQRLTLVSSIHCSAAHFVQCLSTNWTHWKWEKWEQCLTLAPLCATDRWFVFTVVIEPFIMRGEGAKVFTRTNSARLFHITSVIQIL